MTRSKRIRPVVEIVENRERDAAQALGLCRKNVAEQEQRLQELLQYRDEYNQRLLHHTGQGMDARKLHEYQIFLSRLNQAIEQQQQAVHQAVAQCDEKNRHWMEKRSHARAIGKVEQRYRSQEQHEAEKREQKEMDEHALRRYQLSRDD